MIVTEESEIKKIKMLSDKKIGIQKGSASEIVLNDDSSLLKELKEVKTYNNNTAALAELASKKIDAVIIDEIVGNWNIAKRPGIFKVLSDDMGQEDYAAGFRKDDITFKEAFDKVLSEIISDKAGDVLSKKWFGENILIK